jgi:SAM-dependent methyltransferase
VSSPNSDSLERIVPDDLDPSATTGAETLELHLERYRYASRFVRPGRLLDIACGVGYGTQLLAERGEGKVEALGLDRSAEAIAYAEQHYGGSQLSFHAADAMEFHCAEGFDTIVSLETVEHLPEPARFLGRMVGMLRPKGHLVASVPTTPSVDLNPHHLHDFTEASFRAMLAPYGLAEIDCLRQVQKVRIRSILSRSESRLSDLRQDLPRYYLSHPDALLRRLVSTLRYGFSNRYITIVWQNPAA